jgi:outer membrane protein
MALFSAPLAAETLQEALAAAYNNNPTLAGARAGQRAQDENVPLARADGLPSANASVTYNESLEGGLNADLSPDRSLTVQGQISVPLYQGGVVRNNIRAAQTRVHAGQALLRGTEASIFSQVVAVYMDVLRDEAVVSLNRNNVEVLSVNLQATRDRFDIGDLTRTDVAQSEARLALARSQMRAAEATLITSRENYIRLIGHAPVNLQSPPPLPGLPADVEVAVDTALADNPDLLSAQQQAEASGYDVRSARGARMPHVSLSTTGAYNDYLGSMPNGGQVRGWDNNAAAGVTVTIPIFQGGRPAARVRQAQARESQALEQVIEAERGVIAQTRSAYASWQAATSVAESSQVAVDANRLSLEGVRAENSVGTRTILDILNAEQELLNAQVQLVTAKRDAYVAGFTLLAAMGHGEARDLGLDGGVLYDPNVNYERVRNRIWDWDEDPTPHATTQPTRNTTAQTAVIPGAAAPQRPQ